MTTAIVMICTGQGLLALATSISKKHPVFHDLLDYGAGIIHGLAFALMLLLGIATVAS